MLELDSFTFSVLDAHRLLDFTQRDLSFRCPEAHVLVDKQGGLPFED
jgi:hypothetical protein